MENVQELKISSVVAEIDAIGLKLQNKIHRASVVQIRWMIGIAFVWVGLVLAGIKFLP